MLKELVDYARSHGAEVEPGFKSKYIRWVLVYDQTGSFLNLQETGDPSLGKKNPGRKFAKCPDFTQPELIAGGQAKSHFLTDTAEVVALYGRKSNEERTRSKHAYFVSLLNQAGEAMPVLRLVATQLSDEETLGQITAALQERKVAETDKLTFMVDGRYLLDETAWHDWWRSFRARLPKNPGSEGTVKGATGHLATRRMRCLVTGRLVEPVMTHGKIEKLSDVGGQPSGDALVSFDKEAFRSYGLEQSANAAMSEEIVSAYRSGLNDLVRNHGKRLAGAKVVHWFKTAINPVDDPLAWLEEAPEQQERNAQSMARELLQSVKNGERKDLANNYYFALTLSGVAGRVMVRDWMEGQFEDLAHNIAGWFDDLSIVHRDGGTLAPPPKFLAVLGATVRDLDELAPPFVAHMWRVAVKSEPLPASTLAKTLARTRVDFIKGNSSNHAGIGLLKMYRIRQRIMGGESMEADTRPYLNEAHPEPAYHCGRLMAVMARLQEAALGDVGAGVVQRYYASASTTPALVLGRLTRTSQFHLNKLSGGLAHWYEDKIASIWSRIRDSVPATLSLEEQSLFALGYYQQLADMRTKRVSE